MRDRSRQTTIFMDMGGGWHFRRPIAVFVLVLAFPLLKSFGEKVPTSQPAVDFPTTWLLHLPGIGGELPIDHDLIDGLKDGGWNGPTVIYDWTGNDPGLDALLARKRNEREAQKVADMIEEKLRKNPGTRITITAHSAGTGIAIWALEKLPEGMKVQTVMMLASALSPGYDLSKSLRHVRGNMYCFYSANDTLVLGAGTKMFGTIDGKKSVAAGLIGFEPPEGADKAQYVKLVQRPWLKEWMAFENVGSHIGCMSEPFSNHVLAPVLIEGLSNSPRAASRPVGKDEVRDEREGNGR